MYKLIVSRKPRKIRPPMKTTMLMTQGHELEFVYWGAFISDQG